MAEHECEWREKYGNQMHAAAGLLDQVAELERRLGSPYEEDRNSPVYPSKAHAALAALRTAEAAEMDMLGRRPLDDAIEERDLSVSRATRLLTEYVAEWEVSR